MYWILWKNGFQTKNYLYSFGAWGYHFSTNCEKDGDGMNADSGKKFPNIWDIQLESWNIKSRKWSKFCLMVGIKSISSILAWMIWLGIPTQNWAWIPNSSVYGSKDCEFELWMFVLIFYTKWRKCDNYSCHWHSFKKLEVHS